MSLWQELGFEVIPFSDYETSRIYFNNEIDTYYFACKIKNCVFKENHKAVGIIAIPSEKCPDIYIKFYSDLIKAYDEIDVLIDLNSLQNRDVLEFEEDSLKIHDFEYFSCLEDLFDLIRAGRIN